METNEKPRKNNEKYIIIKGVRHAQKFSVQEAGLLALAVMLASAGTSFQTPAQDQGVEEIVVTGSFIRGTPEDAPSPVTVIDRDSIQEQGFPNLGLDPKPRS